MGLLKKDHIRSILQLPRVSETWAIRHGARPGEKDVEELYAEFTPMQIARLAEYSDVIQGVPEAVAAIRERGLAIGSTTGYTRPMLDVILPRAAAQGYVPDASVTPDEAGGGRPAPWMCWKNLQQLMVFPPASCVKIGDTPSDMEEGLNAGMWTIGVIDSGNEIGLSHAEWIALSRDAREQRRAQARLRLQKAGAHFVSNTLGEAVAVMDRLEQRLRIGLAQSAELPQPA
jgi:phosphonoacetaldehyde hydrolase